MINRDSVLKNIAGRRGYGILDHERIGEVVQFAPDFFAPFDGEKALFRQDHRRVGGVLHHSICGKKINGQQQAQTKNSRQD